MVFVDPGNGCGLSLSVDIPLKGEVPRIVVCENKAWDPIANRLGFAAPPTAERPRLNLFSGLSIDGKAQLPLTHRTHDDLEYRLLHDAVPLS